MEILKKITHLAVYQIYKDRLFDNVNSYEEMNRVINKYGGANKTEEEKIKHNNNAGYAFEVFTQFFFIRYNAYPELGVKDIQDTSDLPMNPGFDFIHKNLYNKRGHIQSKWRSNPSHQFTAFDMGTNGDAAYGYDVEPTDNILFINFDDNEDLFHYDYKHPRKCRRVIGRKTQEETYIIHDPNFWNDFRNCIKLSAQNYFVDPPKLRDIQEWVLYGNGIYQGTQAVINGLCHKGRVEAATASGKSLCIFNDVKNSFNNGKKIAVVLVPWLSLIDQTFDDFYKYKMFGHEDKQGNIINTGISCLVIRSGSNTRYNNQIVDVHQCLSAEHAAGNIISKINLNKKVVVFITMKSYNEKYNDILNILFNKGIHKNDIIEIIDEYHNMIPSTGERKDLLHSADYIQTFSERNGGTIFYSASNKIGSIISSLNEEQFGPLLCKVTREDLRTRGYVCPKLIFKVIKVTPLPNASEIKRNASRDGIDIDKAQNEAVGIITAFADLKNYYAEPNLITFGDHVAGCKYVSACSYIQTYLEGVNSHFMCSDTSNNDRKLIIDIIKDSGNNILNQHSVAKEGVNIPNLHGGLIDRTMNYKSLQQAIGRSDRAIYEDTIDFKNGKITLDNPDGWRKYYNVIYVVADDDDTTFVDRVTDIVRYLKENGIPDSEWDISLIDDEERGGAENNIPNTAPSLFNQVLLDPTKFNKMIRSAEVKIIEEMKKIEECDKLNGMTDINWYGEYITNI